jgi:transcriptional antiterminator RfaH
VVPLFRNYLFLVIVDRFYDAKNCPGVDQLLLDGERPARVPDIVISSLKARQRGGVVVLPSLPRFRAGDAVRVTRGPFSGLDALYSGQAPRDRARVLLQWLGVPRLTILAESDIERA